MSKLCFLGNGGSFSKDRLNTSAYLVNSDIMVLIDCGESVFHKLLEIDVLNNIRRIYIILTHFHSDHVGSLGSLLFYCRFKGIKDVNIVFPIKEFPYLLLKLFGISEDMFNVKSPKEIDYYYLKEYEQLHGDIDKDGNLITIPSFGYHLINDNDNFFYSGDTCVIPDIVLTKFNNKEIKYMYYEVSNDGYKAHIQLDELVKLIKPENRKRVVCMHFGDNFDIERLNNLGFNSAR